MTLHVIWASDGSTSVNFAPALEGFPVAERAAECQITLRSEIIEVPKSPRLRLLQSTHLSSRNLPATVHRRRIGNVCELSLGHCLLQLRLILQRRSRKLTLNMRKEQLHAPASEQKTHFVRMEQQLPACGPLGEARIFGIGMVKGSRQESL